ncbi:hypothetical protein K466DRAFT_315818 [Polyporus arcularius HHB13444]|uniref:AB hydrolase-1 domain-containing protein n=1 Tax=Polyporus arcularius HHB13444 TaxID=1314778 RepID=A0A5C3NY64_9APHY|nr:hypothetical protein K466DRAFT_315818 [Polyporus arcularius HHB13444]
MPSIQVDDKGTELAYLDTGAPQGTHDYLTIVAIHGMVFCAPIYERIMKSSADAGVRFVAVNRRDYPGSTPLSEEDLRVLESGTDEERATFLRTQAVQLATFLDRYIQQHNIPAISSDRKTGGILLLGWSLGCTFGLSILSNADIYPEAMRTRLALYLRSYIMFEPPTVAIGSPRPKQLWSPVIDTTLPEDQRSAAFVVWVTSYFKHGDLSTRDTDVISYWIPARSRAPSIFNFTDDEYARAVYMPPGDKSEMLFMFFSEPAIQQTYNKACFDRSIRALFPGMKIWVLSGDVTSPHGIPAFWSMEDDDAKHGGGFIEFRWVPGANHFHFWESPSTC